MPSSIDSNLLHWNYFLALESDLAEISRFIEFSPNNFKTFSIELSHLLLAASSEIDVVCKQLCNILAPSQQANNIDEYREIITSQIPEITDISVNLPRYNLQITPWKDWQNGTNPQWWIDHNKVKHDRAEYYDRANLENVISALSALFIILLYFYKKQTIKVRLDPVPNLFIAPRTLVKRDLVLGLGVALHFEE